MAMDNAKMNKSGTMRKVLRYMKRYIPLLVTLYTENPVQSTQRNRIFTI